MKLMPPSIQCEGLIAQEVMRKARSQNNKVKKAKYLESRKYDSERQRSRWPLSPNSFTNHYKIRARDWPTEDRRQEMEKMK